MFGCTPLGIYKGYLPSLTILAVICLLSQLFLLYQHTTFLNDFKLRHTLKLRSLTTLLVVMFTVIAQKRDGEVVECSCGSRCNNVC